MTYPSQRTLPRPSPGAAVPFVPSAPSAAHGFADRTAGDAHTREWRVASLLATLPPSCTQCRHSLSIRRWTLSMLTAMCSAKCSTRARKQKNLTRKGLEPSTLRWLPAELLESHALPIAPPRQCMRVDFRRPYGFADDVIFACLYARHCSYHAPNGVTMRWNMEKGHMSLPLEAWKHASRCVTSAPLNNTRTLKSAATCPRGVRQLRPQHLPL